MRYTLTKEELLFLQEKNTPAMFFIAAGIKRLIADSTRLNYKNPIKAIGSDYYVKIGHEQLHVITNNLYKAIKKTNQEIFSINLKSKKPYTNLANAMLRLKKHGVISAIKGNDYGYWFYHVKSVIPPSDNGYSQPLVALSSGSVSCHHSPIDHTHEILPRGTTTRHIHEELPRDVDHMMTRDADSLDLVLVDLVPVPVPVPVLVKKEKEKEKESEFEERDFTQYLGK
jgi:hypothetical protein